MFDPRNASHWRHSRPGPQTRWGNVLVAVWTADWTAALCESDWISDIQHHVDRVWAHFGTTAPENRIGKEGSAIVAVSPGGLLRRR